MGLVTNDQATDLVDTHGLRELLDQEGNFGRRILDLDYDVDAEDEAELGWLNCSLRVTGAASFSVDDLVLSIVQRLQQSLAANHAEPAHLKTIGMADGRHAVANLVSSDTPAVLSLASGCRTRRPDLIVNARVAVDPQVLEEHLQAAVQAVCQSLNATPEVLRTQSFRPGRPNPTYRHAEAV